MEVVKAPLCMDEAEADALPLTGLHVVPALFIEGNLQSVTRSGDGVVHPVSQQRANHSQQLV